MTSKEPSNVSLIRDYFDPPKPTMDEMKELTKEERQELGDMIRALNK
jgi:hypothetical protein